MSERQHEYEVAFSFCARDEGVATQLDDLLRERYKTFIYNRKQEVLAGTDGEKTFNEVFMHKARIAVILYRPEWGTTPFTRIEETAIRKRAYDEGYDFTVWIAMEPNVKLPEYVEPTRLYYGLPDYGINGAAGVIVSRIQSRGGNTRPETIDEKAARIKRHAEAQEARRAFLSSHAGATGALTAARELLEAIAEKAEALPDWGFRVERMMVPRAVDSSVEVVSTRDVLLVMWHQPFLNTTDKSYLKVQIWGGLPPRAGRMYFPGDEPSVKVEEVFEFDRALDGSQVWRKRNAKDHFNQAEMVDHCLGILLDAIHKAAR